MAKARDVCDDCGSPLVPSMRGLRCPKLGSCGRGGVEERRSPGTMRA